MSYWEPGAARIHEMRKSVAGGMGHGCEYETSFQLATRPDLVKMDRLAGRPLRPGRLGPRGATNPTRTYARRPRPQAGHAAIFGDPTKASAEAGKAFIAATVDALEELPQPPGLVSGAEVEFSDIAARFEARAIAHRDIGMRRRAFSQERCRQLQRWGAKPRSPHH